MSRNEREWAIADNFSKFCNDTVYPSRWPGAEIQSIDDKEHQRTCGDKRIILPEKTYNVDEKAYSTIWDGCLIELIQDVSTKNMGWYYELSECDYLICGYYDGDAKEPSVVIKILWDELKTRYIELAMAKCRGITYHASPRGYGLTIFAKVPWAELDGVVERLYRHG